MMTPLNPKQHGNPRGTMDGHLLETSKFAFHGCGSAAGNMLVRRPKVGSRTQETLKNVSMITNMQSAHTQRKHERQLIRRATILRNAIEV